MATTNPVAPQRPFSSTPELHPGRHIAGSGQQDFNPSVALPRVCSGKLDYESLRLHPCMWMWHQMSSMHGNRVEASRLSSSLAVVG